MKLFNRLNRSFLATAACAALTLHTSNLNADGLPVIDKKLLFARRMY
jgi:hypothetical protein